jgi:hypothetical protein
MGLREDKSMKMLAVSMFAIAATGSLLLAPPPEKKTSSLSIVGETKYTQPALVRLRASGVADKAGLLWRITPRAGVQRATTATALLEFAGPAGTYEIDLVEVTSSGDGTAVRETSVSVTIVGPGPAPIPPKPMPPPGGKADPAKATCRISFGSAGCTATICGPRRADGNWDVLTASHCCAGVGARGVLHLNDGSRAALEVVAHSRGPDLAWMIASIATADPPWATLATATPPIGTKVWHMGFGVDRPNNREEGEVIGTESASGQIAFALSVSSGDSGSGIFRTDTGELVAAVCCTSGVGRRVRMYGGSSVRALTLRPAAARYDGVLPVPIPIIPPGAE